jgi:coenzyme PQQ precursor peptide PqqA
MVFLRLGAIAGLYGVADQRRQGQSSVNLIDFSRECDWTLSTGIARLCALGTQCSLSLMEDTMKTWTKPAVREQEVGLEVTSYLPAEIDLI